MVVNASLQPPLAVVAVQHPSRQMRQVVDENAQLSAMAVVPRRQPQQRREDPAGSRHVHGHDMVVPTSTIRFQFAINNRGTNHLEGITMALDTMMRRMFVWSTMKLCLP